MVPLHRRRSVVASFGALAAAAALLAWPRTATEGVRSKTGSDPQMIDGDETWAWNGDQLETITYRSG